MFKLIVIDEGLRAEELHLDLPEAPIIGTALNTPRFGVILVRHVIAVPRHGFAGLILGWPAQSVSRNPSA